MRDFLKGFIPDLITSIVAFSLGFFFAASQYSVENERISKCLKNDKCLEYIKKYGEAPSKELLNYLTVD